MRHRAGVTLLALSLIRVHRLHRCRLARRILGAIPAILGAVPGILSPTTFIPGSFYTQLCLKTCQEQTNQLTIDHEKFLTRKLSSAHPFLLMSLSPPGLGAMSCILDAITCILGAMPCMLGAMTHILFHAVYSWHHTMQSWSLYCMKIDNTVCLSEKSPSTAYLAIRLNKLPPYCLNDSNLMVKQRRLWLVMGCLADRLASPLSPKPALCT